MYLNPFTALPFGSTAASSISVDKGTSLYDLLQVAFALRGPQTGTVPIANANYPTSAGDAVLWNRTQALAAFQRAEGRQARPGRAADRHEGRLTSARRRTIAQVGQAVTPAPFLGGLSNAVLVYLYL